MNALQTSLLSTPDTVFTKTTKGYDEVVRRVHQLDGHQRRVLIMIDGRRSVATVATTLVQDNLDEIISLLAEQGFIAPKATGIHPIGHATDHLSTSEAGLRDAKDFMISVARSCLGLLAADLITRIERVERTAQLPLVIGYWVAAIRDTKFGKHLSEQYLDQLKKALPALELR